METAELSERLALNVDIAKAKGWLIEKRPSDFYLMTPYTGQWTCSVSENDAWIKLVNDGTVPDWTRDLNLAWSLLIEMHNEYDVEMNVTQIQYWDGLSYEYEMIDPLDAESTAYAICRVWRILNED